MSFFDIVKAFLPLLVIGGLLYTALHFVKKYGTKRLGGKTNSEIKILSTQMIMPKRYISVIKIQDSFLVLGVTDNSINVLKELDPDSFPIEEADNITDSNFLSILKKNISKR